MHTFEIDGPDHQPVAVTLKRTGAREWIEHLARHGEANLEEVERLRSGGNRRARRRAAAQARKGVSENPARWKPGRESDLPAVWSAHA